LISVTEILVKGTAWLIHAIMASQSGEKQFAIATNNSSVGIQAGWLGFDSWWRQEIFIFSAASKLAMGPPSLLSIEY
jgi:hypothetical protein